VRVLYGDSAFAVIVEAEVVADHHAHDQVDVPDERDAMSARCSAGTMASLMRCSWSGTFKV
jgi:hypothetical protein